MTRMQSNWVRKPARLRSIRSSLASLGFTTTKRLTSGSRRTVPFQSPTLLKAGRLCSPGRRSTWGSSSTRGTSIRSTNLARFCKPTTCSCSAPSGSTQAQSSPRSSPCLRSQKSRLGTSLLVKSLALRQASWSNSQIRRWRLRNSGNSLQSSWLKHALPEMR